MKNFRAPATLLVLTICIASTAQTQKDTTVVLKEAKVSAAKKYRVPKAGTGFIELSSAIVSETPSFLGETDLMKTIQLLPGIKPGTEGFSGLYVRGGGPDENLIMLDGIPIYSPGHMLGLFSVFQEEVVESATVHKGAFPAYFGGRVSGFIDVNTNDINDRKIGGSIGIGLLSDKLHIDGPVIKGRTGLSISCRGMHTFLMNGILQAARVPANYYFDDFHVKASHRLGDEDLISFSYFAGKDKLYYNEGPDRTDLVWGIETGSLKWSRRWNEDLSSVVLMGTSDYSMATRFVSADVPTDSYSSGMKDVLARVDFHQVSIPRNDIRYGGGFIRHRFKARNGIETAFYVHDEISFGELLTLSAGLRASVFTYGRKKWLSPEPRLGLSTDLRDQLHFQISYSRMSQYLHLLSPSLTTLPVDLWVPVTKRIKPLFSDQYSAGISYDSDSGWGVSIEGYFKGMRNVIEYKDGVMFIEDFETWEDQVATGIGRSRGAEILVRKDSGKTTGWIGYTLSRSERRFPDRSIGGGQWFPCWYDSLHDITLALNRYFGNGWSASLTWTYSSGGAITVPERDGSIPLRGNCRLPPSHRLDVGIKHHKEKGTWNFGLYNAYNRKNPNIVFYVSTEDEDSPGSLKTVNMLPIIPSISYTRAF